MFDWIVLFVLGALPLIESRIAIPIGIFNYGLPGWQVFGVTLLGNIIAVAFLLWLLPFFCKYLRKRWHWLDDFLEKLFHRTRHEHSRNVKLWGDFFLFLFVSVPLPGSGGWTAALVAFVFGFPFRRSLFLIGLGLIAAGVIVMGISLGGIELFALIGDGKFQQFFSEFFAAASE